MGTIKLKIICFKKKERVHISLGSEEQFLCISPSPPFMSCPVTSKVPSH